MFPAASLIPIVLVRFRPIDPLLVPVVPVVLTETVQVAEGELPEGVAEVIVGAVPPVPLVTSPKLPVVTPDTGSLKVTVHESGPAFTLELAPARLIETTVGGVVSPWTETWLLGALVLCHEW